MWRFLLCRSESDGAAIISVTPPEESAAHAEAHADVANSAADAAMNAAEDAQHAAEVAAAHAEHAPAAVLDTGDSAIHQALGRMEATLAEIRDRLPAHDTHERREVTQAEHDVAAAAGVDEIAVPASEGPKDDSTSNTRRRGPGFKRR